MKTFTLKTLCVLFLLGFAVSSTFAEEKAGSAQISPEMMERFERLEAETQQLREEVARLNAEKEKNAQKQKKARLALQGVDTNRSNISEEIPPVEMVVPEATVGANIPVEEMEVSQQEVMTRAEVDAYIERHIRDNAWKVGKMRLTPYGMVWASVLASDRKMDTSDWIGNPLPGDANDRTVTSIQARTSRLGMKIESPDVCILGGMKSYGIVEVDFANQCNTENKGTIQLREAYWALENDCYKILFGQAKDIISPLYSHFFDYNDLYGIGNLGFRNPMLSFTRYFYLSGRTKMDWTTGLVQVCGLDHPAYDQIGSYPTLQSRIGWTIARDCCRYPIKFGVGAHIGEMRYDFPGESDRVQSWSVNVDLDLPITDRFGVRGEFFHGQGLAGNMGGCCQSIDYDPATGLGSGEAIRSTGGWAEIWWDWTDQLHWAVGYGGDDPNNADIEGAKIMNSRIVFVNVKYDFTEFLCSGLQYTYRMTDYRPGAYSEDSAHANGIEWMWRLTF